MTIFKMIFLFIFMLNLVTMLVCPIVLADEGKLGERIEGTKREQLKIFSSNMRNIFSCTYRFIEIFKVARTEYSIVGAILITVLFLILHQPAFLGFFIIMFILELLYGTFCILFMKERQV